MPSCVSYRIAILFYLLDRIVEFTPGESLVGIKNVTINEPFFQAISKNIYSTGSTLLLMLRLKLGVCY